MPTLADPRFRKARVCLAVSQALGLMATCAHAQTGLPSAARPADDSGVLQQVVVTAQRRSEKLLDVPVATTAITAGELESRGIGSVADLASLAPNLQVSQTPGNATAAQIAIRGSVTTNPALFWEPTVGLYVDGVYVGKTQGSVFELVDLERVEVLRGPQGTLYGRNTLAGAINLVTRKPGGQWYGNASVDFGSDNARVGRVSLELPAFGPLKLGVGARAETRDGWVKTTPGSSVPELNNRDNQGLRLAATLDLGRDFTLDYRFDRTRVDQYPRHSQLVRASLPGLGLQVVQDRAEVASVDGPLFERMSLDGHALTAEWKLGSAGTLKYVAARRTMDWDDALDLDGSPVAVAHTSRLSDYRQTSHELQWLGSTGAISWVAGVYRLNDRGFTDNPQSYFFGSATFNSTYGFSTAADSAFGQLDWRVSDRFTLTGGLRHTRETKTVDRFLAAGTTVLVSTGTTASASFSATTPLVSLGWKLDADTNLYARYAEGFKSGGFNGEAQSAAEVVTPYRPEKLKSIELGMKASLLGGRAQLNVAVFHNRSDDLQQAVFTAQGSAASNIRNVGRATMQGLEIEGQWRVNRDLRLQLGYGYLDARFDEFMELGVNVAGNRAVVHAPRHTLNLVADATLARTSLGVLRGVLDYAYTGPHYLYPYQLTVTDPGSAVAADTRVKGVGLLNARLSLGGMRWGGLDGELSLWARNLSDRKHVANLIDFGPGFGNLTQAYYTDPRTVGVNLSVRW